MAQKALREIDAKRIVSDNLGEFLPAHVNTVRCVITALPALPWPLPRGCRGEGPTVTVFVRLARTYKAKGVQLTGDHFLDSGRQSLQVRACAPGLRVTAAARPRAMRSALTGHLARSGFGRSPRAR